MSEFCKACSVSQYMQGLRPGGFCSAQCEIAYRAGRADERLAIWAWLESHMQGMVDAAREEGDAKSAEAWSYIQEVARAEMRRGKESPDGG